MDSILVPFVTNNPFSLLFILGVLKIVAKATPWAVDDEIVQLVTGITGITGRK